MWWECHEVVVTVVAFTMLCWLSLSISPNSNDKRHMAVTQQLLLRRFLRGAVLSVHPGLHHTLELMFDLPTSRYYTLVSG